MKEIVVIYEKEQIDVVMAYVRSHVEAEVISLDFWVERELRKHGIDVRPLTDYIRNWQDFSDLFLTVEQTSRHWHQLPEMSFFRHKGLVLGEAVELSVSILLNAVQGNLVFFERVFKMHPELNRLVIPHSTHTIPNNGGPFVSLLVHAMTATGAFVATQKGVTCTVIGEIPAGELVVFPKLSFIKNLLIKFYNTCITLCAPRRPLRLYVSDHWRNVKTIASIMPDAELLFVDRKELWQIPLRDLWKHRVRFIHPVDILSPKTRAIAREKQKKFRIGWQSAREIVGQLPVFTYKEFNWWEVVRPAFDFFMESYAERIVADSESVELLLKKEKINRVLVRASVSGQHHFYLMGEVARRLDIPSVEIQHGIGVGIFPAYWVAGHMHVEYVAAYGSFVGRSFVRNGYEARRVVSTGSPRFDRYLAQREEFGKEERDRKVVSYGFDPKRPVVVVMMTNESLGLSLGPSNFTSYEFRDILCALREIQTKLSGVQYILKFRSTSDVEKYRKFVEEIFTAGDVVSEGGDAFSTILLCDFAFSCFSTVAGEVLMARKPMILFPLEKGDDYFYEPFRDGTFVAPFPSTDGGLPIEEVVRVSCNLISDPAFYKSAVEKGDRFLAANYTFDGKASQHVANFLRTVSYRLPT